MKLENIQVISIYLYVFQLVSHIAQVALEWREEKRLLISKCLFYFKCHRARFKFTVCPVKVHFHLSLSIFF